MSKPWTKTLLPSKLPTARILSFGYDAYVADWRDVLSPNLVANHALKLLKSLGAYRDDDDTVCGQLMIFIDIPTNACAERTADNIRVSQSRRVGL